MLTSCSCLPILPKSQLSAQNHEKSTPTLIPIHLQSIQQSSIHAQVSYASAPRTIHPPLCQFITHPSRLHLPMPQVSYASATRKVHPPLNTRSSRTHPIIIHLWHLYSWWWRIVGPNTNKQTNKILHLLEGRESTTPLLKISISIFKLVSLAWCEQPIDRSLKKCFWEIGNKESQF